jgi:hypothetical protein
VELQESLETSLHGDAAIVESAQALVNIVENLRNPKEQVNTSFSNILQTLWWQ